LVPRQPVAPVTNAVAKADPQPSRSSSRFIDAGTSACARHAAPSVASQATPS
jgi:hypothetical protein